MLPRRSSALCAALFAGLMSWTACSSSHDGHLGAAEPAKAPALGARPAGMVHGIGATPEGIVFDSMTNLIAIAVQDPNRLLLLDGTTLAVKRAVPLPGTVRHLQLAGPGGPVLVPVESVDELVEVSLPGGATRITKVGRQPHDATAASGGQIVVGNEFSTSISILTGGVVRATLPGPRQPGGVTGDGTTVAVVDVGDFTVSTFDLTRRTRTAVLPAGRGPTHGVMASRHRLIVADTRGDAILVFGLHPLGALGRVALAGTPYGMAVDAATDTVWVTLTARNEVVALDVSTTTPREIARYPTVRQPNTVAVSPGSHTVWVAGAATGDLEVINR